MSVVLADTSVWITHLRSRHEQLVALLDAGEVLCHPFVIGELACGSIANRSSILALLGNLAQTPVATHDEVMGILDDHQLYGVAWAGSTLICWRPRSWPARDSGRLTLASTVSRNCSAPPMGERATAAA